MKKPHEVLPEKLKQLWQKYGSFEEKSLKPQAKQTLQEFIDLLLKESLELRAGFCEAFMRTHLEGTGLFVRDYPDIEIEIRHPLFRDLFFPFLYEHYQTQKSPYGRWLAQFQQYFYSDQELWKNQTGKMFFPEMLLRECLEENPQDEEAAALLLKRLASGLDYAVHEMPLGLLWELEKFQNVLDEFISLENKYPQGSQYEEAIAEWRSAVEQSNK